MTSVDDAPAGSKGSAWGVPASPGRGAGELHVDVDDALDAMDEGRPVILALVSSAPGDVPAMVRAAGVLTMTGTEESHTGVVARGAGVPAVVGVDGMTITAVGVRFGDVEVPVGATIVVDGSRGELRWADGPMVVGIQLALATKLGMRAVETAEIETQAGMVGDRYHGSKHRQLSVQSLEELIEAEAAFGHRIDPLLTRRNVTISEGRVPRTPGHRWWVGEVELEVVRDAAPCKMLDMEIGDGARTAMRRRAGVICRVIDGATLTVGDVVDLGPTP